MNDNGNPGSLFVIVAPSGAGKTSLVRGLLENEPDVRLSVSFTTRAPRPGERDGIDYRFVTVSEFESRRAEGEFLEWARGHDNLYGTSRAWIESQMGAGQDIILEIDCQGATQVKRLYPDAVGIFIAPPSIEELARRLRARAQDSESVIERRINAAQAELAQADHFEYVIINQHFGDALEQLRALVRAARLRFSRQRARHPEVFSQLRLVR
ncbi:MAG: guanylate kinase [Betaproteobacteria bacterium]